jgi:hypothetical protein
MLFREAYLTASAGRTRSQGVGRLSIMATMPRPIRLQRGTFERLAKDAARHHEDIDSAAERILRNHLPAGADTASALATLGRIKTLRAKMKPGTGAVKLILEGRAELERRAS